MCPFFVHGLCHRPYCHFKHASSDVDYAKLIQSRKQTHNENERKLSAKDDHTTRSEPILSKDMLVPNTLKSNESTGHNASMEMLKDSELDPNKRKSTVKENFKKQSCSKTIGSTEKYEGEDRDKPRNNQKQVVSEQFSANQQTPTKSSHWKMDSAERDKTKLEVNQNLTYQESYFDDISSSVDEVLNAYSMPASSSSTVRDSARNCLVSGNSVTPDKTNKESHLTKSKEKYGRIGGAKIKRRLAHPGAGAAKAQAEEEKRQASFLSIVHAPVVGKKRLAHTSMASSSQSSKAQRPVIPLKAGGKIPTNLRQKYLDCFVDEYLKISSSEKEAFEKAKAEEEAMFTACNMRQSYTNKCSLILKRLRNQANTGSSQTSDAEMKTSETETPKCPLLSSESLDITKTERLKRKGRSLLDSLEDAEPMAKKQKFTEDKESPLTAICDANTVPVDKLYELLQTYLLSNEQLKEFGFPRPHQSSSTVATIADSGLYKSHPIKQLSDAGTPTLFLRI
jgi:hypothetical protein